MDSVVIRFLLLVIVVVVVRIGLAYLGRVSEHRRRLRVEPQEFRGPGSDIRTSWGPSSRGALSITERKLTPDEYQAEHFEPFQQQLYLEQSVDDAFLAAHEIDHVTVIDLTGRLVYRESAEILAFRDRISELLHHSERTIVVNLQSLNGIDSAGLGEVILARVSVMRAGGTMAVVNAPRFFRNLMAIIKSNLRRTREGWPSTGGPPRT
jgi:anti-anti-sigma factor